MKKICSLLCCAMVLSFTGRAQEEGTIDIKNMFIPSAPGLVLADKAPSSIEKPVTPKAFGISLLNLWQGGAVEATPFWFTDKPMFTYEQWINKKITALETFNVSAATFKTDTSSILSVGFRSQLLRIYPKAHRAAIMRKEKQLSELLADLDVEKIKKAYEELKQMEARGFVALEVAGAILGSGRDNAFKGMAAQKSGVWANFRWSPANSVLDFVALARYAWTNNADSKLGNDSTFFDYGLSLNYERKKFNLAAEYVNRKDISIRKNYDRFTFTAVYQLNDYLALVASIGKNFGDVDNIITIFGLNIGIANQKASSE